MEISLFGWEHHFGHDCISMHPHPGPQLAWASSSARALAIIAAAACEFQLFSCSTLSTAWVLAINLGAALLSSLALRLCLLLCHLLQILCLCPLLALVCLSKSSGVSPITTVVSVANPIATGATLRSESAGIDGHLVVSRGLMVVVRTKVKFSLIA